MESFTVFIAGCDVLDVWTKVADRYCYLNDLRDPMRGGSLRTI